MLIQYTVFVVTVQLLFGHTSSLAFLHMARSGSSFSKTKTFFSLSSFLRVWPFIRQTWAMKGIFHTPLLTQNKRSAQDMNTSLNIQAWDRLNVLYNVDHERDEIQVNHGRNCTCKFRYLKIQNKSSIFGKKSQVRALIQSKKNDSSIDQSRRRYSHTLSLHNVNVVL